MMNEHTPMTPEQAAQLIEADKLARAQACQRAIEQAAQEYRCDLVALPIVTPQGTLAATIQVVAR